jgi:hypothetical protein
LQARLVDGVEADPVHGAVLAPLAGAVVAAHHAARELGLVRCRGKVRGRVRVSVRQGYKG